eukprot:CAMPEP_0184485170 /NCGR_PEP_ID=MMETSP0113_2-20130426/6814_1 /TAXON_ID=91329 /ORGANISM="Norrisiella sphaerica, Strain BC52" /LENGTH=306 /DNA_ID=CAMNT_0026866501 /DNA_START=269 /DNA_END=1189 /DNA_ORIENTATION=-
MALAGHTPARLNLPVRTVTEPTDSPSSHHARLSHQDLQLLSPLSQIRNVAHSTSGFGRWRDDEHSDRPYHRLRLLRGGTSNTVTEDTEAPEPVDSEEEQVPDKVLNGVKVPDEYVHKDEPDSDEDTEEKDEREAKKKKEEERDVEYSIGGKFFNFTAEPEVEQAIVEACMLLHFNQRNVTADKVYDICKAACGGKREPPYWVCCAYAEAFERKQNVDDLMYHAWRYDQDGKLIKSLPLGVGAAMQGRTAIYDAPGSATAGGVPAAADAGGGAAAGQGGKDAKKEKEAKKEESESEDEEEQEFDLFD